ncbi:MAG: glycosyltransferase family 2 protein [Flavobacteriales bacterium]|jgi:glycosyltransferase involved in cell wall biosynthesis
MSDYSKMSDVKNEILVSISCTSFNHGEYIRKCIEGFLMQKTNFEFEILLHDDASTDNSQQIIKELWALHPDKIRPVLQTENQYSKGERGMMLRFNFPRARGKYIAICEGDDYWTDPLKLQKQVDFLENNPDYVLCFHDVDVLLPDGELKPDFITKVPDYYEELSTLAKVGNYIHTPSVVFRNHVQNMPSYTVKAAIGDYFLYCFLGQFGKFKHLNDSMAVYRYGVGVWSKLEQFNRDKHTIKTLILLRRYFLEINRLDVAKIFERRVSDFCNKNIDNIKSEDLQIFSPHKEDYEWLSTLFLGLAKNYKEQWLKTRRELPEYIPYFQLLKVALNRLVSKLVKRKFL